MAASSALRFSLPAISSVHQRTNAARMRLPGVLRVYLIEGSSASLIRSGFCKSSVSTEFTSLRLLFN